MKPFTMTTEALTEAEAFIEKAICELPELGRDGFEGYWSDHTAGFAGDSTEAVAACSLYLRAQTPVGRARTESDCEAIRKLVATWSGIAIPLGCVIAAAHGIGLRVRAFKGSANACLSIRMPYLYQDGHDIVFSPVGA